MTNNYIYFIANWKMFGFKNAVNHLNKVITLCKTKKYSKAKIVYCPPYTILSDLCRKIKKTKIDIGAQNCHEANDFGASTGSINSKMIKDAGAKYVILGHSENRSSGESSYLINKKIKSALSEKLKIIFCIGENLEQRKKKQTIKILKNQILKGLKNVKNIKNIFFAYEPIWSIGTGRILEIKQLERDIYLLNKFIVNKYKSNDIKILYGGSVNPKNINDLKNVKLINGFLIGKASQNQNKLIDIIKKTFN